MNPAILNSRPCPVFGEPLNRERRLWHDRVLSLVLPLKRYYCVNSKCNWSGLKYSKGEEAQRMVKTPWRLAVVLAVVALAIVLLLRYY
jgi:hypothetical protein